MPLPPFPEMTLASPGAVPPIVAFDDVDIDAIARSWDGGGAARIGADLVPFHQAVGRLDVDAVGPIPGDDIGVAEVVPPIVASAASTYMPSPEFGTAAVPAASVPILFPSTRQGASM